MFQRLFMAIVFSLAAFSAEPQREVAYKGEISPRNVKPTFDNGFLVAYGDGITVYSPDGSQHLLLPSLDNGAVRNVAVDIDGTVATVGVYRGGTAGGIAIFDRTGSQTRFIDIRQQLPAAMDTAGGFDPARTRKTLIKKGFIESQIRRFCYRPFDYRWIYCEPDTKLLDRGRPEYVPHVVPGNLWIEARQKQPMDAFDRGYVTSSLADNFGNGLSNFFPLLLHKQGDLLSGAQSHPNVSVKAEEYLSAIGASHELLFFHAIAILHSPAYRAENQGALRQDWPRIPLPADIPALKTSGALGKQISALLDIECKVKGVSEAPFRKELQAIAVIERDGKSSVNPDEGDLDLTAGWGHAGKGGATMPGKGKAIERPYTPQESKALADSVAVLGEKTVDVYLNDRVCWRNIPVWLWDYTISGYAVIKKWLSYREKALLGRGLTVDEARFVTDVARRIAALKLLGPRLDENYRAIAKTPHCNQGEA